MSIFDQAECRTNPDLWGAGDDHKYRHYKAVRGCLVCPVPRDVCIDRFAAMGPIDRYGADRIVVAGLTGRPLIKAVAASRARQEAAA